ncbi:MAG TPA: hypothetical protein VFM93_09020 [Candidatus Limnocylindria bacterium]|nr:hypothetical protein [Candidatus Limnocylindria bacterium]
MAASPRARAELLAHPAFAPSGVSAARRIGIDVIAPSIVEGYVAHDDLARLTYALALRDAPVDQANAILHVVPGQVPFERRDVPRSLVLLDLLDSSDPRTKRAARARLAKQR